jgi:hypothetical protein
VYDILIHGVTIEAVHEALTYTVDIALELGLVCQPAKILPPAYEQKFCGFLYNTTSIPECRASLRASLNKVSRALALLSFVQRKLNGPLARLGLSVLAEVLQSLVAATSSKIGSTFLSSIYANLSTGMDPILHVHKLVYYDPVDISGSSLEEMDWWFQSLHSSLSCHSQPSDTKISPLHFGNGSGTGTRGTGMFYNKPKPGDWESWMGTLTIRATDHTTNWKELCTLVKVLRQEPAVNSQFREHTLFYFTDNMVTYNVVHKGSSKPAKLRALVQDLKRLELLHGCQLEVIHVPGDVLIDKGTDSLSYGIWNTALQVPHHFPVAELFEPFVLDQQLLIWAYQQGPGLLGPGHLFEGVNTITRVFIRRLLGCLSPKPQGRRFLFSLHQWRNSDGRW